MFKVIEANTVQTRVTVHDVDENGRPVTGNFGAEFERASQDELDQMVDENWTNREVLEEKLKRVWDIGDAQGQPLNEEAAMKHVMQTPSIVRATTLRFFELMGGDSGKGRTSKKRRGTG